jgi:hypothetical protein
MLRAFNAQSGQMSMIRTQSGHGTRVKIRLPFEKLALLFISPVFDCFEAPAWLPSKFGAPLN